MHVKFNLTSLTRESSQALGFLSIAGDAKVRLLEASWPTDNLPPPTSSLMSIASNKGLLAAAGPNSVIIARTESVRQAFAAPGPAGNDVKPFTPQLTIPIGMRISQVAFSADENFLVISAESGGGLAVYEVLSIMQGNTQTAFELSTNGIALRALSPNPTPEKAELFAAVTTKGDLLMANIKTRQLLNGANGPIMKNGVSCVSWSNRGKQLVAGLGNGTTFQMTPEGEGKAEIARPPGLEGDQHGMRRFLVKRRMYTDRSSILDCLVGEPCLPSSPHPIILRIRQYTCFDISPCNTSVPDVVIVSEAHGPVSTIWSQSFTSLPFHSAS